METETISKKDIFNEIEKIKEQILQTPEDSNLYIKLGELYDLNDNQMEAIHAYQQATQKDRKNIQSYYKLGLIYHKSGFRERAIDSLETALGIDNKDYKIWNNLGFIHWELNALKNAKLCYDKAREINPTSVEILRNIATLNYSLENYEESLEAIQTAIKHSDKENAGDLIQLAMCLSSLDKKEEALNIYEKIITIQPDDPGLLNNYANCLVLLGRNDETVGDIYKKALELDPDNHNISFNYAEYLYKKGEVDKSSNLFQEVLRKNPHDLESLQYVALCYEKNNPQESLKIYQKIFEINPNDFNTLYKIASIQEQYEMTKDSIKNRKRIFALKPNHWENNLKLGKHYLTQRDIKNAWDLLKYNPKIGENDVCLLLQIAEAFQYNKNYTTEIDVLQLIVKHDSNHFQSWVRLAELALKNKSTIHAYKYINKAKKWLQSDILFSKALAEKLLEEEEIDKAMEISNNLIKTVEITNAILEPFIKKIIQKDLLQDWVNYLDTKFKKLDTYTLNNLIDLLKYLEQPAMAKKLESYSLEAEKIKSIEM